MITLKNIEMTLDKESIENAIKAVEDLENDLGKAMTHLIEELTIKGVEFARMEIVMFDRPAVDTGTLLNSITSMMLDSREGVVTTDVTYAAFVEYGTGVVGAEEPHPEPNGYQYDINGHGWDGWVYKDASGMFHRTYGMPARPFMYGTLRDLETFAEQNGGRIIAEYIP